MAILRYGLHIILALGALVFAIGTPAQVTASVQVSGAVAHTLTLSVEDLG